MKLPWKEMAWAFLCGAILGVAAGSHLQRMALHRFWERGPDGQRIMARFTRELSLDAGQQESFKKIMDRRRAEMVSLHKETEAKFDRLRLASRTDMEKLLRPDQMEKFKAMSARWDAHRKQWTHKQQEAK